MHKFYAMLKGFAAVAVMSAVVWTGASQHARAQATGSQPSAKPEKKYKDQGEYDIYNEVTKDIVGKNYAKAITDLNTWKQKYPESDFKDSRSLLYVQAYADSGQNGKAVDAAGELLTGDPDTVFSDPKTGAADVIRLLFTTSRAIRMTENPTAQELAIGEKAARKLKDYNRKPEGMADDAWAGARTQLQNAANDALLSIAVVPANQALAKDTAADCETASSAYARALQDYPDKSFISYQLARAYNCIAKKNPEKAGDFAPKAIYEFIRAAVTDPTLGGSAEAKRITDYANSVYTNYHGSNEGLDQVKEQAKAAPLPPANFTVKTATQIAAEQEEKFKAEHPQLAMWLGIKRQLSDVNGQQYFDGQLKDAAVPPLKGTLLEGKPACRSKELLLSFPVPDQQGTAPAEVTLKLDAPLTGKAEAGVEIEFEGVPSAFTKEPFMLTMDQEKAKIKGLKTSPCAATPARSGAKKGSAKKK